MAKWNRAIFAQGVLALLAFTLLLAAAAKKMEPPSLALASEREISVSPPSAPTLQQQPSRRPATKDPSTRQPDANVREGVFHGMILKNDSDFVFRDQSGIVYRLDSPGRAKPFVGKPVRITGKSDEAERLIHVVGIQPADV